MEKPDQTARIYDGRYRGMSVLIIGSGRDLDGRKMQDIIDGDNYDIVVRVNKHYGSVEDVGSRTDIIITRWNSWLDNVEWFTADEIEGAKEVVILNQHIGWAATEYEWLCRKVGHKAVSAGVQAIEWALNRGVASIDVIGFGRVDGQRAKAKTYTTGSVGTTPQGAEQQDNNPHYDWTKEDDWIDEQSRVKFL